MLPRQIKIGALTWDVVLKKMEDLGLCDQITQKLFISPIGTDANQEATLIHEMLHACCHMAGIKEGEKLTEEQFVTRLEYTLYTALKQNNFWPSSSDSD